MKLTIRKWGNSAAVRLPAAMLKQLGVGVSDRLHAVVQQGGLVLRPACQTYALADLIAQCDLNAAPPADAAAWRDATLIGREE